MVNIIGLSLDGSDSDDKRILINTETITHWQPAPGSTKAKPQTIVHFIGGGSITVAEDIWDVCYRVDPDQGDDDEDIELPTVTNVTRRITKGTLTPGTPVTIEANLKYSDGTTMTTTHDTTFVGVEHSDYAGKDYYRCEGGTYSTVETRTGCTFAFAVDGFTQEEAES